MRRSTSLLACCAPLVVTLASCGASETASPSGREEASGAVTVAVTSALGPRPVSTARATLGAALAAARQAEAASDPAFHFRLTDAGVAARSRAAGLRARVDQAGFSVEREAGEGGAAFETSTLRCDGRGAAVTRAAPRVDDGAPNRVEWLRRAGAAQFVEWVLNGPRGVEHGYTLADNPCEAEARTLTLGVSVRGLLARAAGAGVELVDASGVARVRYAGLYAEDAAHRPVPARLRVRADATIDLELEIHEVVWPIVVDPLVTTPSPPLVATGGAADDGFGAAVAVSGTTAIIGAPSRAVGANEEQGVVYVFERTAGAWSQKAVLTASDGTAGDEFGRALGLDGDLAVIGAPRKNRGAGASQGAAYAFVRGAGGWTEQTSLVPSDTAAGDELGAAVAVRGPMVILGAPTKGVAAQVRQGAAFIFETLTAGWKQRAMLTAGDGAANDQFGTAVSIEGQFAVVGAPLKTVSGRIRQGAAYVFTPVAGPWLQQGTSLTAAAGAAEETFGASVAIANGNVLAGAPGATVTGRAGQGAVYWFVPGGGGWVQQSLPFSSSDGAAGDRFGSVVSLRGRAALVSAPAKQVGANAGQGSAYLFARATGAWSQLGPALVASDGAANDRFGSSASLSDDTALLGASFHAVGANSSQGAAYAFTVSGLLGSACTSAAGCADPYVCNSNRCSLPCQVCASGDPASCTPLSGVACDDGNACTRTDTCVSGVCAGANPNPCDCSTGGACNAATGLCGGTPAADGTPCSVGLCAAGACVASPDAGPDGGDAGPDANDTGADAADAPDDSSDASDATAADADGALPDAASDTDLPDVAADAAADTDIPGPPPAKADSGGCSCRTQGNDGRAPLGAFSAFGAFAAVVALRRRARR